MNLIFENSVPGRKCDLVPPCDVPVCEMPQGLRRAAAPRLPELSRDRYQPPLHQAGGADLWREQRLLPPGFLHHEIQPPHQ